jgi:hypothetical protein
MGTNLAEPSMEFVVRLPVKDSVAVPPQPHVPGPGATTRSLRILIIDNNHDTAEALAQILQVSGHETGLARRPRHAGCVGVLPIRRGSLKIGDKAYGSSGLTGAPAARLCRLDDAIGSLLRLPEKRRLPLAHHLHCALAKFRQELGVVLQHPLHQLGVRAGVHELHCRCRALLKQLTRIRRGMRRHLWRGRKLGQQIHVGLDEFEERLRLGLHDVVLHGDSFGVTQGQEQRVLSNCVKARLLCRATHDGADARVEGHQKRQHVMNCRAIDVSANAGHATAVWQLAYPYRSDACKGPHAIRVNATAAECRDEERSPCTETFELDSAMTRVATKFGSRTLHKTLRPVIVTPRKRHPSLG